MDAIVIQALRGAVRAAWGAVAQWRRSSFAPRIGA